MFCPVRLNQVELQVLVWSNEAKGVFIAICVGSISVFSRDTNQRQNDKSIARVNYQPVGKDHHLWY